MKKTILYLLILLILGFGVYYFIFKPAPDSPYTQTEAGFTIKDTAAIGKIFLASPDGESILLERTDSGWVVNKKYKALKSTLQLLLLTLTQQEALYPVTKNAYDNVIKALSTASIKVEVYGRDSKKIRVFYVGGAAVNNAGTNMLIEGAHTPYVVQIGSFNGALTPRYTTNLKDWRDRTVFDIPADEIKSISVKYAGKPLNSFEITRDKDSLIISADPAIAQHLDGPNTRRAHLYLKYFTDVNCEGYLNGLPDNDTTIKTAPKQSSIDIVGMHGQHQHADIYWMALNRRSKNRMVSNAFVPDDYDADRLYAVINNYRDTVMIQQFAFRNVFRNAVEFFQKDGTPVKDIIPQPNTKNVMLHKNQ
jgi:hypothetical protein